MLFNHSLLLSLVMLRDTCTHSMIVVLLIEKMIILRRFAWLIPRFSHSFIYNYLFVILYLPRWPIPCPWFVIWTLWCFKSIWWIGLLKVRLKSFSVIRVLSPIVIRNRTFSTNCVIFIFILHIVLLFQSLTTCTRFHLVLIIIQCLLLSRFHWSTHTIIWFTKTSSINEIFFFILRHTSAITTSSTTSHISHTRASNTTTNIWMTSIGLTLTHTSTESVIRVTSHSRPLILLS